MPLTTLLESLYQSAGRGAEHEGDNHILYGLKGSTGEVGKIWLHHGRWQRWKQYLPEDNLRPPSTSCKYVVSSFMTRQNC